MNTAIAATTKDLNLSSLEKRALDLLGNGVAPVAVAAALGVSESRISQLVSDEVFAGEVAKLRYERLQKQTALDDRYDGIEDRLLGMLEKNLTLIMQPAQILKALQVVNAAKRRGASSAQGTGTPQSTIVTLNLPQKIVQQYIQVNNYNQVVTAGSQDLVTIQPATLLKSLENREGKGNEHEHSTEGQKRLGSTV